MEPHCILEPTDARIHQWNTKATLTPCWHCLTYSQLHTRTHARTHTHTHMHTHARTRTHTHTHTKTRTHARTCTHQTPWSVRGVFVKLSFFPPRLSQSQQSRSTGLLQFSSRWYPCARKGSYALHPFSQTFPQRCRWNSSNDRHSVWLRDFSLTLSQSIRGMVGGILRTVK